MKTNSGSVDRILRLGLVPLLTAGVKFCPLYRLIGVSTCPRE